jgi:hypothetical protein
LLRTDFPGYATAKDVSIAFDGRERGTQFVGYGGDEFTLGLFSLDFLGHVAVDEHRITSLALQRNRSVPDPA